MANLEDSCPSISAGGESTGLEMQIPPDRIGRFILGRVIEFARRGKRWMLEKLSQVADVDRSMIEALEHGAHCTELTVVQVAQAIGLSFAGLLELAGLTEPRHEDQLRRVAIQFAARSQTTARLSQAERKALDDFVDVLAEDSD